MELNLEILLLKEGKLENLEETSLGKQRMQTITLAHMQGFQNQPSAARVPPAT